jgi:hypothetical protein
MHNQSCATGTISCVLSSRASPTVVHTWSGAGFPTRSAKTGTRGFNELPDGLVPQALVTRLTSPTDASVQRSTFDQKQLIFTLSKLLRPPSHAAQQFPLGQDRTLVSSLKTSFWVFPRNKSSSGFLHAWSYFSTNWLWTPLWKAGRALLRVPLRYSNAPANAEHLQCTFSHELHY